MVTTTRLLRFQKLIIIIFGGITITIILYISNIQRIDHHNKLPMQIVFSDQEKTVSHQRISTITATHQSLHHIEYNHQQTQKYTVQSNNQITTPPIPSLMIIGPPKSGTTSLLANLAYYFPNWHHQIPQKENGQWYNKLRSNVVRDEPRFEVFHSTLSSQISLLLNGERIKISTYDFDALLTNEIWSETSIIIAKNAFIKRIHKGLDINITNNTYLMEKTAFNYYLYHLALIFRKYFSSTHHGTLLNDKWYSHKTGTKMLAILRDPTKRLISWHSMKVRYKSKRKSMDHFLFNLSKHSIAMEFRTLIINRKNEYDDTEIMLKYIEWIYKMGHNRHGPWPNIWLSSNMLMFAVEYPALLFWIYAYQQKGLSEYFKVIGFNYMVQHFKEVMIGIRCWIEEGITDEVGCDKIAEVKYVDTNDSIVLEHMNKYGKVMSDELMEYMDEFYSPLKYQTSLLVQRTGVVLGVWDESDVLTSW